MEIRSDINYYDNRFLMFVLDEMAYHFELEGKDVIRLTLGKSELPLHSEIINEMQDALQSFEKSSQVFPAGLPDLKNALSEYYAEEFGVEIPPKNFIISVGTSSIFRNLFQLLLSEEDEVLLPLPYYSLYHFCAKLVNAKVKFYSIDPETMRLDMESFRNNFSSRTKVVVINTPGNPLGNVITEEDLYEMDRIVNGQAVIINDEIYANMYFEQESKSVMNLQNTKSVFITTDAFSKAFRMYSRRVGYCIVPDELIEPLSVIQHHTLLTLDPVVQYGAIKALEMSDEVKELRKAYKERRDYAVDVFKKIEVLDVYNSQGGFYLTINCKKFMEKYGIKNTEELAKEIMNKTYVATVPGSDFGLDDCLRLSFSNKRFNEGIDRLALFFDEKR